MDSLRDIKLSVDDDKGTALIQFNRPAKRNAFAQSTIGELVAVLAHLDSLETVRAVIITGGPDGPFCGACLPLFVNAFMSPPPSPFISAAEAKKFW